MDISIAKYCQIKEKKIILNGNIVFENPEAQNLGEFIRSSYKFAGMVYPKFYKMDDLCKLALVAAELTLKDTGVIEKYDKDNVGVMFQNSSSTIDTDSEFQLTIDEHNNYFPSPAVFVYTLPNIMIGEICIKHKIFGENMLFVEPEFKPDALCRHLDLLFEQQRIKAAIAGWVEQNKEHYEAFVYLAEINPGQQNNFCIPHNAEQLTKIYQEN